MTTRAPLVGILMGSETDLETLEPAEKVLRDWFAELRPATTTAPATVDRP